MKRRREEESKFGGNRRKGDGAIEGKHKKKKQLCITDNPEPNPGDGLLAIDQHQEGFKTDTVLPVMIVYSARHQRRQDGLVTQGWENKENHRSFDSKPKWVSVLHRSGPKNFF